MHKRKILIYSPSLYPCRIGGVEIFNENLISNLNKKSEKLDLLVLTLCKKYISDNTNALYLKQRYFGLRRFGLGGLSAFLDIWIFRKIKLKEAHILYTSYTSSFSSDSILFILLLKWICKIPYIIHLHGGGMRKWNPHWLHKYFFKHAYKIAGVSDPICIEYGKRSGRKIDSILPIIKLDISDISKNDLREKYKFDSFNTIILFVGSLKPLKAPDVLIQAFLSLDKEFIDEYNPCLVICGDGVLKKQLEKNISTTNYKNRVFLMGNIPNNEIKHFYKMSDVYVIPSWFEGTPISLIQAMQNNLISIGSDVTGINSVIIDKKNGYLFPKNDADELSKILHKVLTDRKNVSSLIDNAKKYVDDVFNYDDFLSKFTHYIEV